MSILARPSRNLFIGLLLGMVSTAAVASESVSITVISPYAYESDPTVSYGQVLIQRGQALGTPLAVNFVVGGSATRGDAADGSAADFDLGSAFPKPATPGTIEQAVIPAGASSVLINVSPHPDSDQRHVYGELGEKVTFQLRSDGNSGLTYTVTDLQTRAVNIIDADIDAQVINLGNIEEQIGADVNSSSSVVTNGRNSLRVLFPNSLVRGVTPTTSLAPYARNGAFSDGTFSGRFVEVLRGGTATLGGDYDMTYHIGGSAGAGDLMDGELVRQDYAYRLNSENGIDALSNGSSAGHVIANATSFSQIDVTKFDLPTEYYNLRIVVQPGDVAGVTDAQWGLDQTFPGYESLPGDGLGHSLTDEFYWGDLDGNNNLSTGNGPILTFTGNQVLLLSESDDTRYTLVLAHGITADIRQSLGNVFYLAYEVITRTSNGSTTNLKQTTKLVAVQINENVIYPAGASSVAVSGSLPVRVGDVFSFSNDPSQRYRVCGPTPQASAGVAASGYAVNRDANNAAIPALGVVNPSQSFICFWPPLQKALTRDEGVIILDSTYTAGVADWTTDDRMVVHIPGLPAPADAVSGLLSYSDFGTTTTLIYPDHSLDSTSIPGLPNDLPEGDWIDFTCTVLDDNVVEGAESVTISAQTSNANNGYAILNPGVATLLIGDNDSVASVAVVRPCIEGSTGAFRVTLTAPFPKDIQIPFIMQTAGLSNPANWNINYPTPSHQIDVQVDGLDIETGIGSVVLPAGQTSVDIVVQGFLDLNAEALQQLRLQLIDSSDYVLVTSTDSSQNATAATMNVTDMVGTVGVTASTPTATESSSLPISGQVAFNLVRNTDLNSQTATVTVSFALSGSATRNVDYQVVFPVGTTGTIDYATGLGTIILPGSPTPALSVNSVNMGIRPIDDTLVEGPESVIVTVIGSSYRIDGTSGAATVSLLDDEPVVGIAVDDPASEPITAGHFRVSYTGVPVGTALNRNVTVSYTVSGTATPDQDYNALSGVVTIPAGSTFGLITVSPNEDLVNDPNETVIVTLSPNLSIYSVDPAASAATMSIGETRNSQGTVSVLQAASQALESPAPVAGGFYVALERIDATFSRAFTVPLTVSGTAIATTDYNVLAAQVTFPVQPSLIGVSPAPGTAFTLRSSSGSQLLAPGARLDVGGTAVTAPTISVRSAAGAGSTSLSLATDAGSLGIKAGTTLIIGGHAFTIPVGTTISTSPVAIAVSPAVSQLGAAVGETAAITLTADTAHDVVVTTATAVPAAASVSLLSQRAYLPVLPIDDLQVEGTETVTLTMTDGLWYTTDASASAATVSLLDDEPVVGVTVEDSASEPVTTGHFRVAYAGSPLGSPLPRSVTVAYTVAGTATAGVDYGTLSGTVTIPAGSLFGLIDVTPIEDLLNDPNETVVVTLTPNLAVHGIDPSATSATMTIGETRDSQGTVAVIPAAASALESPTPANGGFYVTLERTSAATNHAFSVPLTVAGTATSTIDYNALASTVSFPTQPSLIGVAPAGGTAFTLRAASVSQLLVPGARLVVGGTAVTAPVVTVRAAAAAGAATLSLATDQGSLALRAGTGLIVGGRPFSLTANTTITTTPAAVAIAPAVTLLGTAVGDRVAISLATDTTHDVTVTTATAVPAAATVSLLSQATYLALQPIDDLVAEGTESVSLAAQDGLWYTIDATASATTVQILDDEPTIAIAAVDDSSEPTSVGHFRVSYVGVPTGTALTRNVVVGYNVAGTATSGTDYTALSGTVTIPAGSLFALINVTAIDDTVYEGPEQVSVTLTGGSDYTLDGTSSSAQIAVLDDEPVLSVAVVGNASEPSAAGSFRISYPGAALSRNIVVTYTVGGTATAGTDYTALSGTATIPAGSTSVLVTVTPVADTVSDPGETVVLTLGSATAYGLNAAATSATLTINEPPTVTIVATPVAGSAALFSFKVTFSNAVTGFDPTRLTVVNGTRGAVVALDSANYTVAVTATAPGTVTLNAAAGLAINTSGIASLAGTGSATYDPTAPTVTLSAAPTSVGPNEGFTVTIRFSETVTGFSASKLTVGNGTKGTLSGSGLVYTLGVTAAAEGTVTVRLNASGIEDAVGNDLVAPGDLAVSIVQPEDDSGSCSAGGAALILGLPLLLMWRRRRN